MLKNLICVCLLFTLLAANALPGAVNDENPSLKINDLYVFNSYETGKEGFVTIIANYAQRKSTEFKDVFFDDAAVYEINIDTDGNGNENQTYRFSFKQRLKEDNKTISIVGQQIPLPFFSFGNIQNDNSNIFRTKSYEIEFIRKKQAYQYRNDGPNRKKPGKKLRLANSSVSEFEMPENLIDDLSFSDYGAYSNGFIYDLNLRFKKCQESARVFVGQRQASSKANLTGIENNLDYNFTAINGTNTFADESVLSIALELPKTCLDLPDANSTIAVWASIHHPARTITRSQAIFGTPTLNSRTDFVQIARKANPFVEEFLIGYNDKIKFNQERPRKDVNLFKKYFDYPALAQIIENSTSFTAPTLLPRSDLEEFYLSGLENINQFTENKKAKKQRVFEALRLETNGTALAAIAQNPLGVIGGDNSGYPNGRRPGDDVVDIFFRTLMGFFEDLANAPDKNTAFSDGVDISANEFKQEFPYLNAPQI